MEMNKGFAEGFLAARIIGQLEKAFSKAWDQRLDCPCCGRRLVEAVHQRVEKHDDGVVAFLSCVKCCHKMPKAFPKSSAAIFIECDEVRAAELLPMLKSFVADYDYDLEQ